MKTPAETDIHIFSDENIYRQIKRSQLKGGYFLLRFYSKEGQPSSLPTDTISPFYLYPSGGTLRDSNFNIVFYSTKFDTYKG
jgi:hypothetical protein